MMHQLIDERPHMQYDRYWQAKKITFIGALINALLGCIKIFGGVLFHSHALIADGVHSFSDLFIDAMVIFASKYGSQDADDSHPYGHQRFETAATLILALLLILAGFGIAWDSLREVFYGTATMPGWLSLPIALLSILANEALFHYTRYVGNQIRSMMLIANAWHHRSDAASSLVVFLGLLGSLAGYIHLDAIAAGIVGLMIIKMGISYGWNSVKELVDTAVEPTLINEIQQLIKRIDGVVKVHQLRSRCMGRDIFIDVHIQVSPMISVSEGHFIAQHVHHTLVKKFENVKDVTVHVDPEDDETCCPSLDLPNRAVLEKKLFKVWQMDYPEIQSWRLHYLDGKLIIDIECDKTFKKWQELDTRIKTDLVLYPMVKAIRFFNFPHEITLAN